MNKEYVIINKTAIEAAIEELENEILKSNPLTGTLIKGLISTYKDVLSQSTPLIPENINKILSTTLGSEE